MNDNIMQVLSLLMKEYGYKIKLSSKSSALKKNFNSIIEFFDYYNIQYRVSDSAVEIPCIVCMSGKYFLMNKQNIIVDYNNKKLDAIDDGVNIQYISIDKISESQINLFSKHYFIKEKAKTIFKNKINIMLFCLLAILLDALIWLLSYFVQYFLDTLIGNDFTLGAIKYFIYIIILIILFKCLYKTLKNISIKNNEIFCGELISSNKKGFCDIFHSFILILIIMPFCIYVIYSMNVSVAYILLFNCIMEILFIYIHKLCIENHFEKTITLLNASSTFIYFITVLPYFLLSIILFTYDSISIGYFGMISVIYFSLIYQFIIIDHNLEYLLNNYISVKKYFIDMAISESTIGTNIKINDVVTIKKYKNIENVILQPSKIYLFHGKRNSGKTYLAKVIRGLIRDPKVYAYLDKYKIVNLNKSLLDDHMAYINPGYCRKEILLSNKTYIRNDVIWIADYFSLPFLKKINSNIDINDLLNMFDKESNTNQFLIVFSLLVLQNKKIILIDGVLSYFDDSIFNKIKEFAEKLNLLLIVFEQGNNHNRHYDDEFGLK